MGQDISKSMDRDDIIKVKFMINDQKGPLVRETCYFSISHEGSFTGQFKSVRNIWKEPKSSFM